MDEVRVVDYLRARMQGASPSMALVLGSGLGAVAASVEGERIPYREIPGFPTPTVSGHKGELVLGDLEGVTVLLQDGRYHLYEGHDPRSVVLPVRLFAELGVESLIVTNAAGCLNPTFSLPP